MSADDGKPAQSDIRTERKKGRYHKPCTWGDTAAVLHVESVLQDIADFLTREGEYSE